MSYVVDAVNGVTCLDGRLYVISLVRRSIGVFAADTFSEVFNITVNGLIFPWDIVACRADHQLYLIDTQRSIWRVSAVNPSDSEKWLTDESLQGFCTMSVTSRRLLVTSWSGGLRQYSTTDKKLLRAVKLPDFAEKPTHGVETPRGTFVVCHGGLLQTSGVSELFSFIICLLIFLECCSLAS